MVITHIDAHGPDHGISIQIDLDSHEVTIRQWGELCEPDEEGSYCPHIQSTTVSLRKLLDKTAKHNTCMANTERHDSRRDKIAYLALNWLAYWGGEEERVDDGDRPCNHFGSYWGRDKTNAQTHQDHFKCDACGAMPSKDP